MITYTTQGRSTILTGSTYDVKDTIQNFGGKWMPEVKGWKIGNTKLEALKKAIAIHESRIEAAKAKQQATWVAQRAARVSIASASTSTTCRSCKRGVVYLHGLCRSCSHDEL
jgi:hypothetical protein